MPRQLRAIPDGPVEDRIEYRALPTLKKFHESNAEIRCIVGAVGSGKTSGASVELFKYIPDHLWATYGIRNTRWVILRNTYPELRDTTQRTVFDWFPHGELRRQENIYTLKWEIEEGRHKGVKLNVEAMFRSCDRPEEIGKFKSLEITGYWIDESIEVAEEVKRILKNRIGRFPRRCPERFGIETTNPPDVEHDTYSQFAWVTPPPGPVPSGQPLKGHVGFWQPPFENEANLPPNYYDRLREDYRDNPDWVEMYVEGKPGIIVKGRMVYTGFSKSIHVASEPLEWKGDVLFRGWDNSGNCPACVVGQIPEPHRFEVLREFWTDREGIVDFTSRVVESCNSMYPGAYYVDWGDPAGSTSYSRREGGFTSNAALMRDVCKVDVRPSENNLTVRIDAVQQRINRHGGLVIDPVCVRLINGFVGGYAYPKVPGTDQYGVRPMKNKWSHPHDALQYVCVGVFRNMSFNDGPVDYIPPPLSENIPSRDIWMI